VQGDDAVHPDRLEQARQIARGHRVARLGLAIFARVAEVGHDRGDARRGGVLQRTDEEQQPAQLVVGALIRAAVERLHDVAVAAAHALQRSGLVLAVLEIALLVRAELGAELRHDALGERPRRIQREQRETAFGHRFGLLSSALPSDSERLRHPCQPVRPQAVPHRAAAILRENRAVLERAARTIDYAGCSCSAATSSRARSAGSPSSISATAWSAASWNGRNTRSAPASSKGSTSATRWAATAIRPP